MHGSTKSYTAGFLLSLALTFEAYLLATNKTFSITTITITVLALAIVQLLVQLFFFLHFDRATKKSWNIVVFLFMALVVSIVVFGSLWIMKNLDYHMQSPADTEQYLKDNEGL